MVFNNTDVLILTVFCGLKVVSVYALYNMVFDMVSTLIANINTGFSFKLGQLYNSNRKRLIKCIIVMSDIIWQYLSHYIVLLFLLLNRLSNYIHLVLQISNIDEIFANIVYYY